MARRLDFDRARSETISRMPSRLADPDMLSEPEHQAWWGGKNRKQRKAAVQALEKQMGEAFGRGKPAGAKRPKVVVSAFIRPRIKALLAQLESASRRREQLLTGEPRRSKKRGKPARPIP